MPTATAPKLCDCGQKMLQVTDGYQMCTHCDQACHLHCDPKGCKEPHGRCNGCNQYRRGIFQRVILRWYR